MRKFVKMKVFVFAFLILLISGMLKTGEVRAGAPAGVTNPWEYDNARYVTVNFNGGRSSQFFWTAFVDRNGYGWTGGQEDRGRNGVGGGNEHADIHYNRWTAQQYTDHQHPSRDASGNYSGQITLFQHTDCVGITPFIVLSNPVRDGYVFTGWSTSAGINNISPYYKDPSSLTRFQSGAEKLPSPGNNIYITATWRAKTAAEYGLTVETPEIVSPTGAQAYSFLNGSDRIYVLNTRDVYTFRSFATASGADGANQPLGTGYFINEVGKPQTLDNRYYAYESWRNLNMTSGDPLRVWWGQPSHTSGSAGGLQLVVHDLNKIGSNYYGAWDWAETTKIRMYNNVQMLKQYESRIYYLWAQAYLGSAIGSGGAYSTANSGIKYFTIDGSAPNIVVSRPEGETSGRVVITAADVGFAGTERFTITKASSNGPPIGMGYANNSTIDIRIPVEQSGDYIVSAVDKVGNGTQKIINITSTYNLSVTTPDLYSVGEGAWIHTVNDGTKEVSIVNDRGLYSFDARAYTSNPNHPTKIPNSLGYDIRLFSGSLYNPSAFDAKNSDKQGRVYSYELWRSLGSGTFSDGFNLTNVTRELYGVSDIYNYRERIKFKFDAAYKNKVFYAAMHSSLGMDGGADRFLTANSPGAKYFVIDPDPPVNTTNIPSGTWTNSSSFIFTADSGGIYSAPVSEAIIFNSNATVRLVQGVVGSGTATFIPERE